MTKITSQDIETLREIIFKECDFLTERGGIQFILDQIHTQGWNTICILDGTEDFPLATLLHICHWMRSEGFILDHRRLETSFTHGRVIVELGTKLKELIL